MTLMALQQRAEANFAGLKQNPYPGRVIVVGLDEKAECIFQVYGITGRSQSSRNRVLTAQGGRLFTELADLDEKANTSLIIYDAMNEHRGFYVVSNGHQTDTVIEEIDKSAPFLPPLDLVGMSHEPDEPHFTSRITAVTCLPKSGGSFGKMSILRRSPFEGCDRHTYKCSMPYPGFGYGIMTYAGDGDILPPFAGDPLLMPLEGHAEHVAKTYWAALPASRRVALAVKYIDISTGSSDIVVINARKKVR